MNRTTDNTTQCFTPWDIVKIRYCYQNILKNVHVHIIANHSKHYCVLCKKLFYSVTH